MECDNSKKDREQLWVQSFWNKKNACSRNGRLTCGWENTAQTIPMANNSCVYVIRSCLRGLPSEHHFDICWIVCSFLLTRTSTFILTLTSRCVPMHRIVSRFSESFDDTVYSRWWNIQSLWIFSEFSPQFGVFCRLLDL